MATVYWPFPLSTVTEWPASPGRPNHWGTDFGVDQGTPLRATVDGTIVRHNNDGLGAYVLDIIADDGLLVRNGHLSRMDVNTGQRVTAGQVIGLTGGQPGTPGAGYSFGPHLHWELRRDRAWSGGAWVDPRNLNPQPLQFGQAPVVKGSKKLFIVHEDNGRVAHIVTEDGSAVIPSGHHQNLWKKLLNSTADNPAVMAPSELAYINETLRGLAKANASFSGSVVAEVDVAKVAKAVNDDAARRMQG